MNKQIKEKKRKDAESLLEERAERTDKEQLEKLDREGLAATKERNRLLKRISKKSK